MRPFSTTALPPLSAVEAEQKEQEERQHSHQWLLVRLQQENESLREESTYKDAKILDLQEKCQQRTLQLQQMHQVWSATRQEQHEKDPTMAKLQEKFLKQSMQVADQEMEIDRLRHAQKQWKGQIVEVTNDRDEKQKRLTQITSSHERMAQQLDELKVQREKMRQDRETDRKRLLELSDVVRMLQAVPVSYEPPQRSNTTQQNTSSLDNVKRKIQAIQHDRKLMMLEVESLQEQVAEREDRIRQLENDLEQEHNRRQEEEAAAKEPIDDQSSTSWFSFEPSFVTSSSSISKSKYEAVVQERNQARNQIKILQAALQESHTADSETSLALLNRMYEKYALLKRNCQGLQDRIQQLEEENAQLENKVLPDRLSNLVEKYQALVKQEEKVREELETVKEEYNEALEIHFLEEEAMQEKTTAFKRHTKKIQADLEKQLQSAAGRIVDLETELEEIRKDPGSEALRQAERLLKLEEEEQQKQKTNLKSKEEQPRFVSPEELERLEALDKLKGLEASLSSTPMLRSGRQSLFFDRLVHARKLQLILVEAVTVARSWKNPSRRPRTWLERTSDRWVHLMKYGRVLQDLNGFSALQATGCIQYGEKRPRAMVCRRNPTNSFHLEWALLHKRRYSQVCRQIQVARQVVMWHGVGPSSEMAAFCSHYQFHWIVCRQLVDRVAAQHQRALGSRRYQTLYEQAVQETKKRNEDLQVVLKQYRSLHQAYQEEKKRQIYEKEATSLMPVSLSAAPPQVYDLSAPPAEEDDESEHEDEEEALDHPAPLHGFPTRTAVVGHTTQIEDDVSELTSNFHHPQQKDVELVIQKWNEILSEKLSALTTEPRPKKSRAHRPQPSSKKRWRWRRGATQPKAPAPR